MQMIHKLKGMAIAALALLAVTTANADAADKLRIGTEGALVCRHRRGHAQPRIGVDISAADKALHQLVGDVIILGQQLA